MANHFYKTDSSKILLDGGSANSSSMLVLEASKSNVENENELGLVGSRNALTAQELTQVEKLKKEKTPPDEFFAEEVVTPMTGNVESFSMNETFDDGNHDFGRVDKDMIGSGTMFNTDLSRLKAMVSGQKVKIELLSKAVTGTITTKQLTKLGSTQMFIKLDDSPASTMGIYYGKELTKGKIYMHGKGYQFEAHGNVGFLMGIYEYKKMKNALFID